MTGEKLIYALVYAAEALIAWQYFEQLFGSRRRSAAAGFTIGYGALYAVSFFGNIAVNACAFMVCNGLLAAIIYRRPVKASLLHAAFLTAAMMISEMLPAQLVSAVIGDYSAYAHNMTVLVPQSVMSKLLYFLCTLAVGRLLGPERSASGGPAVLLTLCAVPLMSMLVAFTIAYISILYDFGGLAGILASASIMGLLFVNILILIAYRRIQSIDDERLELRMSAMRDEANAEYYKMLQTQYDNQRILVHDMKNHLNTINGLALEAGDGRVSEYIGRLGELSCLGRGVKYCDEPTLNLVLMRYSEYCEERGVSLNCDVRSGSVRGIDAVGITALFGNLLSNAAEAAACSGEKQIELKSTLKEDGRTVISVVNSCDDPPEYDAEGRLRTKKSGGTHGLGVKSIERTLKSCGGNWMTYYEPAERRFHAVVTLSAGAKQECER